ncbi:MAG TPA: hypothetical protein EYG03_11735 [Planctomycetes bacterium]|nr:hypothetical protein [Planctomycetota bacterium]
MPAANTKYSLPYAHLNLRRNPFGEFSEDERTSLALVDVDAIITRLNDPHYVVQFIGEKGYGKTTHLLAIRLRLRAAGYVHIPEGERAPIPSGRPILIDEAQRLTRWQQFQVFRSNIPLVLGTHRDFHRQLRLAGRVVETIEVQQGTDVERLHRLLNARIQWVRRNDGQVPAITTGMAERLRKEFGADIRGMLHQLYAVFQNLNEIADL